MTGVRLWVGFITMAVVVPAVILFFYEKFSLGDYAAVAIPCFFGWCIAEFVANVLSRPRIADRKAMDVIKEWENR